MSRPTCMNTTQFAHGDDLAELTVRLRPLLFSAIRRYPLTDDAVEDAVQQTWILFLRHRSTIRDSDAITG